MEYYAELTGLPFGKIYFLNYAFEYTHYCTSIVFQNDKGEVMLGRNFDFKFSHEIEDIMTKV